MREEKKGYAEGFGTLSHDHEQALLRHWENTEPRRTNSDHPGVVALFRAWSKGERSAIREPGRVREIRNPAGDD